MDKEKNDTGVLELMVKNEKTISQLYKTYSEKFPDYKDFWFGLSAQEVEHATWIYNLGSNVKDGSVRFKKDRFDINTIKEFHGCVKDMLDNAKKQEISLENALSNSLSLEYNLIEYKFFEVFESDAEELKFVLKLLYIATNKHIERVQEALDKIKK